MVPFPGLSLVMESFLAAQSWRCDSAEPGSAQIVGIRGCAIEREGGAVKGLALLSDPRRITDRYDDAILVFGKKGSGDRYSAIYRASLQPGKSSFSKPYYKNRGCPIVQPGQYEYRRGHHYPPRSSSYEALRQKEKIVVVRDFDQDAVQEPTDRWDYPSTAINIHAGGRGNSVGGWSEGCQVVYGGRAAGSPWQEFHRLIYGVAGGQPVYHYTVIDGIFLEKWQSADDAGQRELNWLWFGSHGDRVCRLQTRLVELGHYHADGVDGEFGPKTHTALRRYQRCEGLGETGVVDTQVAQRLGVA